MMVVNAIHVVNEEDHGLIGARIPLLLQEQKHSHGTSLNKLLKFLETLKDLVELHCKFKVKLTLAEFDNEDKNEVCTHILDWCCDADEIQRLLEGFVIQFLKKYQCDSDKVLSKYLFSLIDQSAFRWYWNKNELSESDLEDKGDVILKFIQDQALKLDLTLAFLRQAPVPWSNKVTELARKGCDLKDPRTSLLVKEEKLVTVKEMVMISTFF